MSGPESDNELDDSAKREREQHILRQHAMLEMEHAKLREEEKKKEQLEKEKQEQKNAESIEVARKNEEALKKDLMNLSSLNNDKQTHIQKGIQSLNDNQTFTTDKSSETHIKAPEPVITKDPTKKDRKVFMNLDKNSIKTFDSSND